MIVPLKDPFDPRLDPYRRVRERDLVGRDGCFVAEGEVVLRMLAASPLCRTVSVLIADNRIERLGPILAALDEQTPVYAAPQAVMDAVVGFPMHRGILAIGMRSSVPAASELIGGLSPNALVVALFGIGNHDNMGGLFRNAAAFGAEAVLLDPTCCDPLYRKAIRVSVGAALTLPFARWSPDEDPVAALAAEGFSVLALSPRGETSLADLMLQGRRAVLFGSEGPGLPESVLARAQSVRIEMAGPMDSLNVATSCGIVLHHLARVASLQTAPSR